MGKLFGTDGVRGVANVDLTPELVFRLGKAAAFVLSQEKKEAPTILVGMDTRISGDMLESALAASMCSVGAKVICAGVIPTPAVAYLIRHHHFDAGVVISASHNPFHDNGIKFFNGNGYKLSDDLELEIESYVLDPTKEIPLPASASIGTKTYDTTLLTAYEQFLISTMEGTTLEHLKIIVDCANGATYQAAPAVLKQLGADITVIHNSPNGININDQCGSTHLSSLIDTVKNHGADIGIAYDGDGDRCLLVDEHGNVVDGDQIMTICALELNRQNRLNHHGFVATVMSNLGLFMMGREQGIEILQANVGDRYVLEEMVAKGYNLGGEQSGHVIFLDWNTTGDGILTSLQVLKILQAQKQTLSQLNSKMTVLPQVLVNAKVVNSKKYQYKENVVLQNALKVLDEKFSGNGRVLVRPSGTEPLVRVMIEGLDVAVLQEEAEKFAKLIEQELGE